MDIGVKIDMKEVSIFTATIPIRTFSKEVPSIDKTLVVKKPKHIKRNNAIVPDKNNANIV